jgi:4-hydroxy-tetrahydrodipicolinate synthase
MNATRLAGLTGSVVALATPFHVGGIDPLALVRLAERQVEQGSAAIVVCGSTGEAATLTEQEAGIAVGLVVQAVHGRVPVIAGCTASGTEQAMRLAVAAARVGADALLCAAPPYVKPTQAGIVAHVRAIAHAASLPVMLYDVPGRAGVAIADATVADLFARDLIFALKDATADLSRPPRLRATCGPRLLQFSGDDATAGAHRAMGGVGCVSVTANVMPALCAALHRAWDAGDLAGFARLQDQLAPLHDAMFAETNPIPVKAALAHLGLCAAEMRLPLTRAVAATDARLNALLAELGPAEQRAAPPMALALAS